MDIFNYHAQKSMEASAPLAERMRPQRLTEFVGQSHVAGEDAVIRRAIENDQIFSMILWGPPGCGKTTLARIIARETRAHFTHFSAVLAGVKEIRSVIEEARSQRKLHRKKTILFVDEIHRFNKSQQDAFLHHVESGLITLIGATTENPSFEVIAALLSRCRVITLKMLTDAEVGTIVSGALKDRQRGLGGSGLEFEQAAFDYLVRIADGDARVALNGLEIVAAVAAADKDGSGETGTARVTLARIEKALQEKALRYDKSGEEHYNLISALHKSMRGSDPDATLYWLLRMLEAGEDPLYIARRMVRFASEDVGNADPRALGITMDAMEAFKFIGRPEGELALAQAAVYLATAPKSNSIYRAYKSVQSAVRQSGSLPVPLHIRNAPTRLMKDLGYAKGYKYAHGYSDAFTPQQYLPDELKQRKYYHPSGRGYEKIIRERLDHWRRMRERAEDDDK